MPAYNAAQTLRQTYDEVMAQEIVDLVIIVDDRSNDETLSIARTLPHSIVYAHQSNKGYGVNQKSCYKLALEQGGISLLWSTRIISIRLNLFLQWLQCLETVYIIVFWAPEFLAGTPSKGECQFGDMLPIAF